MYRQFYKKELVPLIVLGLGLGHSHGPDHPLRLTSNWNWEMIRVNERDQIEFKPAVCTHVCRALLKRKWCSMCECVCDLALAKWLIQVGCWSYQLTTLNSAWWMDIQLFECLTHNSQHFTLDVWSLSSHFTTSHARVSFLILINYLYTILSLSLNLIILLLFWSSC